MRQLSLLQMSKVQLHYNKSTAYWDWAIKFLPRDATQSAVMRLHVVWLSVCDDQVPWWHRK